MTTPTRGGAGAAPDPAPPHDLAVLYALDCLDPQQARTFERHLAGCADCRAEVDHARETTARLAGDDQVTPPAGLRADVLARIAVTPQLPADASETDRPEVDPTATQRLAERPDDDVRPLPEPSRIEQRAAHDRGAGRTGRRWRRVPYLVAAVAVLVALAGAGFGVRGHLQAQQADQQRQQLTRLLAAQDVATVSGPVTGGGQATIVWSSDRHRAVFVAAGLPAPSDGRVYQLWTISAGGRPVSAGTFAPHRADVVVPLPAAALSAHTVAMTVEPAGGSAQPTSTPLVALTVR